MDMGLFLQTLMLAAHSRGLATCPQVAFVRYERVISTDLAFRDRARRWFVACRSGIRTGTRA